MEYARVRATARKWLLTAAVTTMTIIVIIILVWTTNQGRTKTTGITRDTEKASEVETTTSTVCPAWCYDPLPIPIPK